jgi:hypothetical protein
VSVRGHHEGGCPAEPELQTIQAPAPRSPPPIARRSAGQLRSASAENPHRDFATRFVARAVVACWCPRRRTCPLERCAPTEDGVDGVEEVFNPPDLREAVQHECALEISLVHRALPGSPPVQVQISWSRRRQGPGGHRNGRKGREPCPIGARHRQQRGRRGCVRSRRSRTSGRWRRPLGARTAPRTWSSSLCRRTRRAARRT